MSDLINNTEISDDATTNKQDSVTNDNYSPQNEKKTNNKKTTIAVIVALSVAVIVAVVILFVFFSGDDNLKKAKDNYLPPAVVFTFEDILYDDTNDNVDVTYDDNGRIQSIWYFVNDTEYVQDVYYNDIDNKVDVVINHQSGEIEKDSIDYSDIESDEPIVIVDDFYISSPDYGEEDTDDTEYTPPVDNDYWKQLYKDRIDKYVSEETYNDEPFFSLLLIDDDDIPELLISGPSHAMASTLCWVYDDKLYETATGYTISEGITYIERSGLVRVVGMWQGAGGETINELKYGEFTEIASGEFDTAVNHTYKWEGESVSKSEYSKKLNSVFDTESARDSIEITYTYDEVKTAIDNFTATPPQDLYIDEPSLEDVIEQGVWVDYSVQSPSYTAFSFSSGNVEIKQYSFWYGELKHEYTYTGTYTISGDTVTISADNYNLDWNYISEYDEMQYTITNDPIYEGTIRVFHYDSAPDGATAQSDCKNIAV